MPVTVDIIPRHVRLAHNQGTKRSEEYENREGYLTDTYGGDSRRRNIIGALGELAFAEYADLQIDAGIYEHGDAGYDFLVDLD